MKFFLVSLFLSLNSLIAFADESCGHFTGTYQDGPSTRIGLVQSQCQSVDLSFYIKDQNDKYIFLATLSYKADGVWRKTFQSHDGHVRRYVSASLSENHLVTKITEYLNEDLIETYAETMTLDSTTGNISVLEEAFDGQGHLISRDNKIYSSLQ
jgi:hypothetical protein